ncbi:MAG: 4'-phosphopantetheinyl transferase superfamily protein [Cyanobacteria bacterium J06641_5]
MDISWRLPPARPTLEPQHIHLWQAVLEATPERLLDYWALLAPHERERAERFRFPQHRDRFVVGRGMLRSLLGSYLEIAPAQVQFEYSERGKPFLAAGIDLSFNVSHSRDRILLGFAWNVRLGVDLEYVRPMPEAAQLATRFFCPAEAAIVAALPAVERERAFFCAWTRKEAYLKATGEGILGLADVEVAIAADRSPEILAIGGDRANALAWSLHHLEPATSYVGAVAWEHGPDIPAWALDYWQFIPT